MSEHKVVVRSLHCATNGTVIGAGYQDSVTDLEGVALYSLDRGATWHRAPVEPAAEGIPLSLLVLPTDGGPDRIGLSGYRFGRNVLSAALKFTYEPGPWWATSDAGRSWHRRDPQLPLPPTTVMDAQMPVVERVDTKGTLLTTVDDRGSALAVLRSTDGGRTWDRQSLPALNHYGSLVSDGSGLVVLTGRSTRDLGLIYRSADSGSTWVESRFVPRPGDARTWPPPKALRLYRSAAGSLIAYNNDHLGKGSSPALLYRSIDEGRTWTYAYGFGRVGRILAIAGDRQGHIVAITELGKVLRSDDGGATWRQGVNPVVARTELGASNVVFSDDGVVLATLDRTTFMRSTDAGVTWRAVDSRLPDRQVVLDAFCTDGKGLIVIAGSGGMLTRSTDGGATWQRGQEAGTAGAHAPAAR